MKDFNPNAPANPNSGIFGLPYNSNESEVILIQVPWDATASHKTKTALAPAAILSASKQVDLFHYKFGNLYSRGIYLESINSEIKKIKNKTSKVSAKNRTQLNQLTTKLEKIIYLDVKKILKEGKIPGIIGGDHSVSLGAIKACSDEKEIGVLQFDAHADLRKSFDGIKHSHASIMFNVINESKIINLTQIGVREFCQEEFDFIKSNNKIKTYFDRELFNRKSEGESWRTISAEIINNLPEYLYISLDIDFFDIKLCPNTGTPVPGGLDYNEFLYFVESVATVKKIIGFDLVEVSPNPVNQLDESIGARALYELCLCALKSKSLNSNNYRD
ncbi:MAG: hypothetical protein Greene041619_900 [Candidatus Peregrinibacteria bacterium Greene0416_19]|nr:MAG: hypothetical protein Greene041619_900 [Candidatus Peregrinibacteria bacterium Greene0416_19]